MANLNISVSPEAIFHLDGLSITNSFFTSLLIVSVLLLFAIRVSLIKFKLLPSGRSLQNLLETVMQALLNLYTSILGEKNAHRFFPFLTTFFIFILISNWSGLIPGFGSVGFWEVHEGKKILVPLLRSPSADINTTLALAIVAMIFIQIQGFKVHKLGYLKKFFSFHPIKLFIGIIELISEVAKVISFAFRLFGNIFAGEVLLLVMGTIIAVPVIGSLITIPFLVMEIFVGFVQSLVFVMLILAFTAGVTAKGH